jgi:hypothetical protein
VYDGACDGAGESERVCASWGEVRSTEEETGPSKESSLVKPSRQRSGVSDGESSRLRAFLRKQESNVRRRGGATMEKELWAMVDSNRWFVARRKRRRCKMELSRGDRR